MTNVFLVIMVLAATALSQQQLTPLQIQEAKQRIVQDPEEVRKLIEANPEIANKVEQEQKNQLMNYLETMEKKDTARNYVEQNTTGPEGLRTGESKGSVNKAEKETAGKSETLNKDEMSKTGEQDKVYGHSLFLQGYTNSDFAEIPDDYIICAGDEILLRFWGRYNQERKYQIGQDGYVFIEPLNRQAYLPGMTYGALKDMVQRVSQSSPGVEGDVRIIKAHPVYVHIAGDAQYPGTVSGPAYYSFWQFLILSKGPGENGSVRDIKVFRKGKMISEIDIYDFLQKGKRPILTLQNDDLIFFNRAERKVKIENIVRIPGLYELKEEEKLGDLVKTAGGFMANTFAPRIQIERISDIREKEATSFSRQIIDIDLAKDGWEKTALRDGDIIRMKVMIPQIANEVHITGHGVTVPGRYSLPGYPWSVYDLLKSAGGLVFGAYETADLLRYNQEGTRTIERISLTDTVSLKISSLLPLDSLVTYHDSQFVEITTVQSRGHVKRRVNEMYTDSLNLIDLIRKSEGLRDGALSYVYIKSTDDYGNVSYNRYDIADSSMAAKISIRRRDELIVFDYRDFNRKMPVTVLAYDSEPLVLDYSPDLSLDIIIHELGGLHPQTDSTMVEICSPVNNDAFIYAKLDAYSLDETTAGRTGIIYPGSVVFFRLDRKKESGKYVFVTGEVNRPGRYALLKRKSNISELMDLAGGLTERANKHGISIKRDGYQEKIPVGVKNGKLLAFDNEWILNDRDVITVGRNDYSVEVSGEVFDPKVIAFNESFRWKDYIEYGAGGFTDSASIRKTYIQYPNGVTRKAKKGLLSVSSKIVPGSKIVVPKKPPAHPTRPEEKFDYVKLISATSASLTAVLTLMIIANQLK